MLTQQPDGAADDPVLHVVRLPVDVVDDGALLNSVLAVVTARVALGRVGAGLPAAVGVASTQISRDHAVLQVDGGAFTVTDRESTFGSWVGSVRLAPGLAFRLLSARRRVRGQACSVPSSGRVTALRPVSWPRGNSSTRRRGARSRGSSRAGRLR